MKTCSLIKKEIPTQVFSCEYCIVKFLRTASLVEQFLLLYFSEILCDDRTLWMSLGTKWRFSYFLYYCFVFLHNSSVRISSPWLFRTCFHTKIFSKRNFRTLSKGGSSTILIQSLKIRNNCRTLATSPSNLLWKMYVDMSFWNIILCYYFSLEAILLLWLKITLPKNSSMFEAWSGDIEAWASVKIHRRV